MNIKTLTLSHGTAVMANHFLTPLQTADYYPMGKSTSILYACKLGHLTGKAGAKV